MLTKEIIKDRIRKNITQIKKLGIDLIGLFGSYVRDQQNDQSDIDILISFENGKDNFNNFMEVCFLLEEIFSGVKVEIVTKNALSQYIEPIILIEVEYL